MCIRQHVSGETNFACRFKWKRRDATARSGRQTELSENSPRTCSCPLIQFQPSMTSRCKCRHAFSAMDGIRHPGEESLTVVYARACVWTNAQFDEHFCPFSCSLTLVTSIEGPIFSVHQVDEYTHAYMHPRTHHLESLLTQHGDISWSYGDSSRRCICHDCNVGLILLRLSDVTISFA